MRRSLLLLTVAASLFALPLIAQNTDIESLAGLQFNFGNPGARSLGMGGAFIALADDASAAEANPAGLTILRKPEFTIEGRNYEEQQILTTSGTFPDLQRTAFSHYSDRVDPTFASVVYPLGRFTIVGYYHQPLRNRGSGLVVPQTDPFTGQTTANVPDFYLPRDGTGPVSAQRCSQIVQQANDPFACLQYTTIPFISTLNVEERTFGFGGAWKIGTLSLGATARYQTFHENALTLRLGDGLQTLSQVVQQTGTIDANGKIANKNEHDVTFAAGVKWAPTESFSVGGVYKKGPRFNAPTFAATFGTNFQYVKLADTTFHIPDVIGAGVSFRPIPVLTLNVDAVRVKYSNLVDDFVSVNSSVRQVAHPYKANDATEIHAGGEYFFSTRIPFAIRAGYWRDPVHSVEYAGPLNTSERIAAAILYPKGTAQNHRSIGAGLAWPRFQIDAAYDTSERYKVGSISMVARF